MMPASNDPVCECGPLCEDPTLGISGQRDTTTDHDPVVDQDTEAPTSFFRLPREVRDKIYFLTSRPDCQFSVTKDQECKKEHIHQSSHGRNASWKWLVLCRQTWFEASHYMSMTSNNVTLIVNDSNCRRCWKGRSRCAREGMLHASTDKRAEVLEIELARVRILTIQLEVAPYRRRQDNHDLDRIAHNLASLAAFLARVKSLEQVTIEIFSQIRDHMAMSSALANAVKQVFVALMDRPDGRLVAVNIRIRATYRSRIQGSYRSRMLGITELPPSPSDDVVVDSLLQQARLGGLEVERISVLPKAKAPSFDYTGMYAQDLSTSPDSEKQRQNSSITLWRARVFDEDFDPGFDDDEPLSEPTVQLHGSDEVAYKEYRGPQFVTILDYCEQVVDKYPGHEKFLPLYQDSDFYYALKMAGQTYAPIPECKKCGLVFAGHTQVTSHVGKCKGRTTGQAKSDSS